MKIVVVDCSNGEYGHTVLRRYLFIIIPIYFTFIFCAKIVVVDCSNGEYGRVSFVQEGRPNLGPNFATAVRLCSRREAAYWRSFDEGKISYRPL